jgi:hypothetical protein
MLSFRSLSLAIAATLAIAPAAFAQDASAASASDAAASKRFAVVGGYAHMKPKSDALENAPGKTGFDGGGMPTLSGSWYVNDNFAVELWGAADKSEQRVRANGANVGSIKQQPMAVSGQYHFGNAGQAIRPFVGLGYYESNVSDERRDRLGRRRLQHQRTLVHPRRCPLHEGRFGHQVGRRQSRRSPAGSVGGRCRRRRALLTDAALTRTGSTHTKRYQDGPCGARFRDGRPRTGSTWHLRASFRVCSVHMPAVINALRPEIANA